MSLAIFQKLAHNYLFNYDWDHFVAIGDQQMSTAQFLVDWEGSLRPIPDARLADDLGIIKMGRGAVVTCGDVATQLLHGYLAKWPIHGEAVELARKRKRLAQSA